MERPKVVEENKRKAAGMARATRGRARVFKDRKKEAARKVCRNKHHE